MKPTALPRELIRCWEEVTTDENGKTTTQGISLMRPCEVPQFRTVFLSRCIELFNNWRLFNQVPPMGQGWGNERSLTCKILRILAVEDSKYEEWEREKENNRRNRR